MSGENKQSSSSAPDAMNQTIYQMMTNQDSDSTTNSSSASPNGSNLSHQISSLHSPSSAAHRPIQNITVNTGIPPHFKYLPYPIPWRASAGPDVAPQDFGWVSEACAGRAAIGIVGGAGMGLLMGVFLGAMSDITPPVTVIHGREVPQAPLKEQMRTALRATAEKSLYWSRNFAFITGIFGGSDCLVEKYRGTHDVWNSVLSGCVTGAAMQAKSGPQAAALGCGGFAAFSLVIDKIMGTH